MKKMSLLCLGIMLGAVVSLEATHFNVVFKNNTDITVRVCLEKKHSGNTYKPLEDHDIPAHGTWERHIRAVTKMKVTKPNGELLVDSIIMGMPPRKSYSVNYDNKNGKYKIDSSDDAAKMKQH